MTLKRRSNDLRGFEPEGWLPPQPLLAWLEFMRPRVQLFWDRFPKERVLYTESDFEHVAWAITTLSPPGTGRSKDRKFIEWGCGFGVIAGLASLLGWKAIGIEVESFLHQEAQRWHALYGLETDLRCESFLPPGSGKLADEGDPRVSLCHGENSDFSVPLAKADLVFVYAWPGEEHFLKQVFDSVAPAGCQLLLYRGPHELELFQKLPLET